MKYLFNVLLCLFFSSHFLLANEDVSRILESAKKLAKDTTSLQALEAVKSDLKRLDNGLVKNKAIEVVALGLMASNKNSYKEFQKENADFNFSKLDATENPAVALKKKVSHLILNSVSEYAVSQGQSPIGLAVKVNGNFSSPVTQDLSVDVPEIPAVDSIVDSVDGIVTEPIANVDEAVNEVADSDVDPTKNQVNEVEESIGSQEVATESVFYLVYQAAKKAQSGDSQGIKDLLKLSLSEHGEEINGMLIKTISLAMINSNSKSLKSYIAKVNTTFNGNSFFDFLEEEPLQAACQRCDGKGVKESPCRKCTGGSCRNCKGKKEIAYKGLGGETVRKECAACKGTGNCISCEGSSVAKAPCRTCSEKGTLFAKSVVPQEYASTLQKILIMMPKMADDNNLYIGVGVNRLALAKQEQEKRKKEERQRLMEELVRKRKEEQRLAKLEKEKEAEMQEGGNTTVETVTVESFEEGGTNSTLKHALLEMTEYLNAQERRTKSNVYESVEAKFVNSFPTLLIEVSEDVAGLEKGRRFQYLDGFYKFWQLRCRQNRLGSTVGFIATVNGTKIAEMKKNEVVLVP